MPTYEYRCPQGHDFEKFFSRISEAASTLPCPDCGQEAERRISGGAGLLFKGSGFYLTDYGKNAHRKAAPESGKQKESGGSEGSSAKAESGDGKKSSGDAAKSSSSGGSSSGGTSRGGSGAGGKKE